MLCRDGDLLFSCDVEVGTWYMTVHIQRAKKTYRLDIGFISDLTYEELTGRLLVTLVNGKTLEIQPQVAEDRDVVSKLLILFTLLKNPSTIDFVGHALKAFSKTVNIALELVSTLQETEHGINWKKTLELAEKISNMIESSDELWSGVNREDVRHLLDSVSKRDIKTILGLAKNIITSLYASVKLYLSKILPGTSPEILLDVVLAAVLGSALRVLKVPLKEKEVIDLEEAIDRSLRRFASIMNVDEPLLKKLELSFYSMSNAEELVDNITSVLAKSFQNTIQTLREASRRG